MGPHILHVDLDAFYASVEQRDRPELRGLPLVVGGHPRRGVVLAASYEARRYGVKSAMPMARALALCSRLVVVPPRMGHYARISERFFGILQRHSPLWEGLSLDEAFLDVRGLERLLGDATTIANKIKAAVRHELDLVASVGVASSKFVAKIASDLGKPDGLVVVQPGEEKAFLDPLPVGRLWGVGQVTEAELYRLGLSTIGAVARTDPAVLERRLGPGLGRHLYRLAHADDDRPVIGGRRPVSIGHEDTFDEDLRDRRALAVQVLGQSDRIAERARALGLRAQTITLKVKYADHARISRRITLERATADQRTIGQVACRLLARVPEVERRGVRLTGISLSGLVDDDAPEQLGLLGRDQGGARPEALGETLDRIAERFGDGAVRRAVHLERGERPVRPRQLSRREAGRGSAPESAGSQPPGRGPSAPGPRPARATPPAPSPGGRRPGRGSADRGSG